MLRPPSASEITELDELWHDYMIGLLAHCPKLGADRDPKEPFRRSWRGEDLVIDVEGVPVGFIVIAGTTDDAFVKWPVGSLEVRDVYIAPSHRNMSLAPRAVREAMSRHKPPAWCFFVYAGNRDSTTAISRYFHRLGYAPTLLKSAWAGCPGTYLRLDPPQNSVTSSTP